MPSRRGPCHHLLASRLEAGGGGWLSLNPAQSRPVLGLSQEPKASSLSRESVRETSECVSIETLTRDG